jgi:hypothetical protein
MKGCAETGQRREADAVSDMKEEGTQAVDQGGGEQAQT